MGFNSTRDADEAGQGHRGGRNISKYEDLIPIRA